MDLLNFLYKHIEGYLIKDLLNMQEISLKKGEEYGACGYAMIISMTAGMELLGGIASPQGFPKDRTDENHFIFFCDHFMKPINNKYFLLSKVIYKLVRHGLAHTYLTKHGILVTKSPEMPHLKYNREDKVLFVDANQLFSDFKNGYDLFKKSIPKNEVIYCSNLSTLLKQYEKDTQEFFDELPEEKYNWKLLAENASLTSVPVSGIPMMGDTNPKLNLIFRQGKKPSKH